MARLFGTDGIRGQANVWPITPELAQKLGKALGLVYKAHLDRPKRAIIGKDTRLSCYMLESALESGLVSMGMDVYLVGPIPTPAIAYLTKSMRCTVGIMITASHNPFDHNGIKIFDRNGNKLDNERIDEIEKLILGEEITSEHIRSKDIGRAYKVDDALGRYITFAKGTVPDLMLSGTKILMDCANGSAYVVAPKIFEELGAEIMTVKVNPNGLNINEECGAIHPDLVSTHLAMCQADIGIAFDGDADRVVFCDENGNTVSGDRIIGLCALDLHSQGKLKNNTVVVTEMSNLGFHHAMDKAGISVEVTEVGDHNVLEKMREIGSNFGGEESGHLIFMDHLATGDGIIAALQVLQIMENNDQPLSNLADCIMEFPQSRIDVAVKKRKPLEDLPHVQAELKRFMNVFGESGEGRYLVRPSGTEKLYRVLVETKEERDASIWAMQIARAIEKEIG